MAEAIKRERFYAKVEGTTIPYEWRIENFVESNERIGSDLIGDPSDQSTKWEISLYPNGFEEHTGHVSILLNLRESQTFQWAKFNVSIIDVNGREQCSKTTDVKKFYNSGNANINWGWYRFIARDDLINPSNGYLNNKKLTLKCEIIVINEVKSEDDKSGDTKLSSLDHVDPQLCVDIGSMVGECPYSDGAIEGKGWSFPIHKNILASRSKRFQQMFKECDSDEDNDDELISAGIKVTNEFISEKHKKSFRIDDVDKETAHEMLRYIYSGKVNLSKESLAKKLLIVANTFEFKYLMNLCEEKLCENLTIENAAELLNLADTNNAQILKDTATTFYLSNVKRIMATEGFRKVRQTNQQLLFDLILMKMATMDDERP